ncbi:hypothetical protein [Sinosporangium siamense]|uniref:hypothetical protein n=1 Tax=Sinosporangium siamense TaxID=1367973 RepID=UPI001951F971|nr:hypothetical protein [Sinosporangium siamense]
MPEAYKTDGVDDELAKEFVSGGGDDADVEIVAKQENMGLGVGSPDTDVVQASGHLQGDHPGVVDALATHPGVGVGATVGGREPP